MQARFFAGIPGKIGATLADFAESRNKTAMLLDLGASALMLLPAEPAHGATLAFLKAAGPLLPRARGDDPRLGIDVLGLRIPNPIGLAAGFDKNAEVPGAMLKLGFGFVECGTVTPRPQAGNPRPRLFRLAEDGAVINRMGFNNEGMERVEARLVKSRRGGIMGINIGANKNSADRILDYGTGFARLAPYADYIAANVSSPNTPGLRGLQKPDELRRLLRLLTDERARLRLSIPLLLKIAPDLDDRALDEIAEVALDSGVDGMILTNTTIARENLASANAGETGGLSGRPLFARSTEVLRFMRKRVGAKLVLVGVGGVASGADAYVKIRAGASLVQLYTALAYAGPGLIARIKRELSALLARDGFARVADAVGADIS